MRRTTADGSLWVRRRFWRLPDDDRTLTTPITLGYADLIAAADAWQVEATQTPRACDDLLRRIDRAVKLVFAVTAALVVLLALVATVAALVGPAAAAVTGGIPLGATALGTAVSAARTHRRRAQGGGRSP